MLRNSSVVLMLTAVAVSGSGLVAMATRVVVVLVPLTKSVVNHAERREDEALARSFFDEAKTGRRLKRFQNRPRGKGDPPPTKKLTVAPKRQRSCTEIHGKRDPKPGCKVRSSQIPKPHVAVLPSFVRKNCRKMRIQGMNPKNQEPPTGGDPASSTDDIVRTGFAAARLAVDSVFTRRRSYNSGGARFHRFWFDRIRALDAAGLFNLSHGIRQRITLWCPPYDRPARKDRRPVPACGAWYCPFCRGRQVRKDASTFWSIAKADPAVKIVLRARQTPFRPHHSPTFELPSLSVAAILGGQVGVVAGLAYRRPICRARPDGQMEWTVQDTAVALVRPDRIVTTTRLRRVVPVELHRDAARSVVVSNVAYAGKFPGWLFFLPADKATKALLGWTKVRTETRIGRALAPRGSASRAADPLDGSAATDPLD